MTPGESAAGDVLPAKRKAALADRETKMASALFMACTSTGLKKAIVALVEAKAVLLDNRASKKRREKAAKDLDTVQEYLEQTSQTLETDAQKLSPMPYVGYAIGRIRKAQKTAAWDVSKATSTTEALNVVGDAARETPTNELGATNGMDSAPTTRKQSTKKAPKTGSSMAPKPKEGSCYSRKEFIRHVYSLPPKSKERGAFYREVLKQKYVPLTLSGMYKTIRDFEMHLQKDEGNSLENYRDFPWHTQAGAKPLLGTDELLAIAANSNGAPLSAAELDEIIVAKLANNTDAGKPVVAPSKSTLKRYRSCIQASIDLAANGSSNAQLLSPLAEITGKMPKIRKTPPKVVQVAPAPKPKEGSCYGRKEFLLHIRSFPRKSKERGAFMKEVFEKKYVPLGISGMYKSIRHYEKHLEDGNSHDSYNDFAWHTGTGAKRILQEDDLEAIAERTIGVSLDAKDLGNIIAQEQNRNSEAQGFGDTKQSAASPSRSTLLRCNKLISSMKAKQDMTDLL